jgi:D-aminopeptidase
VTGQDRPRPRDIGLRIGLLPTGPTNSIVDVPGVRVGHATIRRDEPDPPAGRDVARTGVTAILPIPIESSVAVRLPAGADVLNGAGETTGLHVIREWGLIETPIFLTSTLAVGRVYDAAVALVAEAVPALDQVFIPLVAECDDSVLSAAVPVQVTIDDVRRAVREARDVEAGPPAMGAVGAGTGMRSFELKGGIGSASRVAAWTDRTGRALAYTVGVMVLANFGELERLTIDGVRVGRVLAGEGWPEVAGGRRRTGVRAAEGSCIVVVLTDAPLLGFELERLARRASLGLGRVGSTAHHGSGEIALAVSTALRVEHPSPAGLVDRRILADGHLDPLFAAVVEATEEAVVACLFAADTETGRDGVVVPGLPIERTIEILAAAGALSA